MLLRFFGRRIRIFWLQMLQAFTSTHFLIRDLWVVVDNLDFRKAPNLTPKSTSKSYRNSEGDRRHRIESRKSLKLYPVKGRQIRFSFQTRGRVGVFWGKHASDDRWAWHLNRYGQRETAAKRNGFFRLDRLPFTASPHLDYNHIFPMDADATFLYAAIFEYPHKTACFLKRADCDNAYQQDGIL
jgi:hypothetical protein